MSNIIPHDKGFSSPRPVVKTRLKGRDVYFVVMDSDIAQRLGVDEENTTFEQAITDQGVIFRLRRKSASITE